MIQNKKTQKTQKDKNFPKEVVENTDLHKSVFNEIMSSQEWDVKYDFVAPLKGL